MLEEKLSYRETARRFEVSSDKRLKDWERIYLTEGLEGFAVERRGRARKGKSGQLPKNVEEDLLAKVQRLRAENEYLKKLTRPGFGERATPGEKVLVVQKPRQRYSLSLLLEIAQLPVLPFFTIMPGRCTGQTNMQM